MPHRVVRNIEVQGYIDRVEYDVLENADKNQDFDPDLMNLFEKTAELVLCVRAKNNNATYLKLIELAGTCINLMRKIARGQDITSKIQTRIINIDLSEET